NLLGLSNFVPGEDRSGQNPLFIEQDPVGPSVNVSELALAAKRKFTFCPIAKNKENNVRQVKVFQEHRLTQQPHKSLAGGCELLIPLICGDQAEIKAGVGISRAPGVGPAASSGRDTLTCLSSGDNTVHADLVA